MTDGISDKELDSLAEVVRKIYLERSLKNLQMIAWDSLSDDLREAWLAATRTAWLDGFTQGWLLAGVKLCTEPWRNSADQLDESRDV